MYFDIPVRPRPNAVQLTLGLPHGITLHRNWHPFEYMALSPNGEMLAFAATDASGESSLWIRLLSSSEARKLEQTEGALLPFWSPDSQFIGFWAGGKLKKIRRSGELPKQSSRFQTSRKGHGAPTEQFCLHER